jgi:hypothetical protein
MVLHEACRIPLDSGVTVDTRREIITLLSKHFEHPLLQSLAPIIENYLNGTEATVEKAVAVMNEVAKYPNQYVALGLCIMCCDDVDDIADTLFQDITESW